MSPQQILEQYGPREAMEYDVVVVGAGPAGQPPRSVLKQLAALEGGEVSVVVLEKGSSPARTSCRARSWIRGPSPSCSCAGTRWDAPLKQEVSPTTSSSSTKAAQVHP